jgi:DNA (cytosine-5)-methyltransferase 1
MTYESVCAGIEAFSQATHDLDFTPVSFAEIDSAACSVLSHHHPDVPNRGDFTVQENQYDAIDLLVGGTPCQDFSVAGLRAGMDGARGQLTVEFAKLAGRKRPRWILWENVPGVLSIDEGRAFGTFLGLLGELGYGFAYRVLDAQHFGVPQRRRRVFVVGHLGDWRRAAAVLFERHSLSGNPPPRREAGQVAPTIPARSLGGGGLGTDFDCDGGLGRVLPIGLDEEQNAVVDGFGTLKAREHGGGFEGSVCVPSTGNVAHCLNAGGMGRQDYETETMVVAPITRNAYADNESHESKLVITHALTGEGFDASEDGTGRGTPLVPVAIQAGCVRENPDSGPDGVGVRTDGIAYTLEARAEVQAVAFSCKDYGADVGDTAPTLRAMGHDGSHANAGGQVAIAISANQRGEIRERPVHGSLSASKSAKQFDGVLTNMAVRRLTPRECERLQGFPDDYTLVQYRKVLKSGKLSKRLYTMADGPRYKMLGNSMAVPVIRWIAKRILEVDSL